MLGLWESNEARTRWVNQRIYDESAIYLGGSLADFSYRCKVRIRNDLKAKSVPAIVIWWIIRFVVMALIEYYFFSEAADEVRARERKDAN